MAKEGGAPKRKDGSDNGPSEGERREESSKAAKSALAAQKKAKELTQAAAGAGDPQERQKLLNEALEQEIAAESFGKTAKYLQSGTFQGMLAGSGIGVGTGAGLGTVTGTLVGGTTSLVTGGLGGAVGSGVGALHGPFIKMGDVAGEGVKKVTGTLPGWEATNEQKGQVEKMVGQVHEQDAPTEDDLTAMTSGGGGDDGGEKAEQKGDDDGQPQQTWTEYAASYMPSGSESKSQEQAPKNEGNGKKMGKPNERARDTEQQTGQRKGPSSKKSASENRVESGSEKEKANSAQPQQGQRARSAPKLRNGTNEKAQSGHAGHATGTNESPSHSDSAQKPAMRGQPAEYSKVKHPQSDTSSTQGKGQQQNEQKNKPRKLEMRSKAQDRTAPADKADELQHESQKKKSPRKLQVHGEVVEVIVGEDKRIFLVHKNLLRNNSAFFDAALKEEWKEGQQRKVTLEDEESELFYRYVQWLYTGRISCKTSTVAGCEVLVKLYVLGEKLLAPTLRDAAINGIVSAARTGKIPVEKNVDYIYQGTLAGSPARQLMFDLHLKLGKPGLISKSVESTNHEFLRDLTTELLRMRMTSEEEKVGLKDLKEGVPCSYHCHDKAKPCGEAGEK
ncbi:hypothetical protein LTR36_000944 [Oleoguttula mirabilis]|uniref:BTB domain-containing protein n=1 Tax=Oleoguttula mirabilis TaxID=1507867 RepID=A0AAV9JQ27_9PEZI|nr:hypothetical protein LTR36_000944 [Oleoguttula mirabilis]